MSADKPRIIEWNIYDQRQPIPLPRGEFAANVAMIGTVVAGSATDAIAAAKILKLSFAPMVRPSHADCPPRLQGVR